MNRLKLLSGAQLKYIAFTSMLIDHVNKALVCLKFKWRNIACDK